jgi:hypothetical protein
LATAGEAIVLVESEFHGHDVVAALAVRQDRFGPGAGPLDRTAQQLRGQEHQAVFVVNSGFHAEGAAHVLDDHTDLAFRHLEDLAGHPGAIGVRPLGGGVEGVVAFSEVVVADAGARFHSRGDDAVDDKVFLDDMGRGGEGGIDFRLVTAGMYKGDVVRAFVPHDRHARLRRIRRSGNGRQRLIVHGDEVGGVHRLVRGLGDHEGDVIADAADLAASERGRRRHEHGRAIAQFHPAARRDVAEAGGLPVVAGKHRKYSRRGQCRRRVDGADHRMGVGGAHHHAMGHARQLDVVDIAPAAPKQARILGTRHPLADRVFTHPRPPSSGRCR